MSGVQIVDRGEEYTEDVIKTKVAWCDSRRSTIDSSDGKPEGKRKAKED